ncbi:hypothetical protein [Methylobacterium tardum]|uniref:hypothetical protein n=1 Tax=Methylobacterium tardum TaxID=374432 RepID=UPI00361588B8
MSLRSVLKAALSAASKALRAAGRVARIAAAPAIMVTEAVADAATGAVRLVSRLVSPQPAVSAAEAQADAYLDAAGAETTDEARLSAFADAHIAQMKHENPEGFEEVLRVQYPEAAALQDHVRHFAWNAHRYEALDLATLPEHVRMWLEALTDDELYRVAACPIQRLDQHLRAKSERDLLVNLAPCYRLPEARVEAEAKREREIARLARDAGADRAASSVGEFLGDLHAHAMSEAGPRPVPFR